MKKALCIRSDLTGVIGLICVGARFVVRDLPQPPCMETTQPAKRTAETQRPVMLGLKGKHGV